MNNQRSFGDLTERQLGYNDGYLRGLSAGRNYMGDASTRKDEDCASCALLSSPANSSDISSVREIIEFELGIAVAQTTGYLQNATIEYDEKQGVDHIIEKIRNYIISRGAVSIEAVAERYYQSLEISYVGTDPGSFKDWPKENKEFYIKTVKAVLDAAGVRYE